MYIYVYIYPHICVFKAHLKQYLIFIANFTTIHTIIIL